MKILLVEDDDAAVALLVSALTDDRHTVNIAPDGQMGLMLAETYDYDLILLDVLVPKLDGISLCRQLRSKGLQMPILLLTAKDSQTDKVLGLNAGADDYVVKPFDLEELRARIRALLRRSSTPISTVLTWEQLRLAPDANEVTYKGAPIALTPKEFGILELFLRHPHRVFSRSAIIDRLWALEESPAENAVTTHIKDLRQKLKAGGMAIDLIETVYGLGYRLKPPVNTNNAANTEQAVGTDRLVTTENGSLKSLSKDLPGEDLSGEDLPGEDLPENSLPNRLSAQKNLASVQRVLEKFRTSFVEQIAILQQASTALQADQLTEELQEQARQEAHKLAGSLGIFGYPNGSRLAQQAEHLLIDATPKQIARHQFSQLVAALQQEIAKPTPPLQQSSSQSDSSKVASTETHSPSSNDTSSTVPYSPISSASSDFAASYQILFLSREVILAEQLQAAISEKLLNLELQIRVSLSLETIEQTIAQTPADIILLDLSIADSLEAGLSFLADLTHQYPRVPVLVLSEQNSLNDRVEVSRLGGKAFLPKPVTAEQILQAIHQALPRPAVEAKILIVDDDLATLTALKHLLQPWGLQVTTLNNPQQFWDVLVATEPDLVVFDLEMPTFSGIDLCQVVRHDPQWGNLPILVVTAHTDASSIRTVFAAGADDFIAKPVIGPELVTRILSRIERVRS